MLLFTYVFSIFLHEAKMYHLNKDNHMSRTHWFQRHNFLFAIGYRNNKDTGPNHSFLWENPWQKAFRQENTERFLLQLFFFFLINASVRTGKCFFPQHLWDPRNQTSSDSRNALWPCPQDSKHPSWEVTPMEPPSSLSPKENKDLQERETNRKEAGKQHGLRLHSTSEQSL